MRALTSSAALAVGLLFCGGAAAQTVTIDPSAREQAIDGFGTCLSGTEGEQAWFQELYYDDLGASILRVDLTPSFKSPYSDFLFNSPWFHNSPALPGPDGNNVRTYTSAADYSKTWSGRSAPIAVMGADLDENVKLFDFAADGPRTQGAMAKAGLSRQAALGDFKLYGSLWSPPPWLKISSGNAISGQSGILPANGTAWPFIWGGNFAGGLLDVSGNPVAELGETSALTQYARSLAAWLRGFQNAYGVKFWAVSLQNEVNFEEFYNSCAYPLSAQYLAILKAARAELDQHPDLAPIRILGPEDLMGGDGWGMWQYGGGSDVTHKNLQYLKAIADDPAAAGALYGFNIHGYAPDGMSSAGSDPKQWDWWAHGWTSAPAAGLPATVKGFTDYGKASWMTETSGEKTAWLSPATGFPKDGGFSIALKIHQALTTGRQSAWIYWQLTDGKGVAEQTLTDANARAGSPKFVAAKHFFKAVRPGAVRVGAAVSGATDLYASAFVDDATGGLSIVLINGSASSRQASLALSLPAASAPASLAAHTSSDGALWQASTISVSAGAATVPVPAWGVVTLTGETAANPPDAGTPPAPVDAGSSARDAGPAIAPADSGPPSLGDAEVAPPRPDAATSAGASDASSGQGPIASGCGCVCSPAGLASPLPWAAVALAGMLLRRARGRVASARRV
ncbi:MAG TPA: hypothetical protein VGK67_25845 [Myxococcales bacterium]